MPQVIVLDSHIWFWWINLEHYRLPPLLLAAIEIAPQVGVSPVSCFELAFANHRGRLDSPLPVKEWFPLALDGSDVELLPLTPAISTRAVELSDIHRDPFDRIIIATALELDARLASIDGHFTNYPELVGCLIIEQVARTLRNYPGALNGVLWARESVHPDAPWQGQVLEPEGAGRYAGPALESAGEISRVRVTQIQRDLDEFDVRFPQ